MAAHVATAADRPVFLANAGSTVRAGVVVAAALLLDGHVPAATFLALAVAIGLPHGAFDHEVGRRLFQGRYGQRWWRPFLLAYLLFVAAMLLLWWAMPGAALAVFLLLSLLHFGEEDAGVDISARPADVLAHGGAVIVVPAVFHPVAVERLFHVLAPAEAAAIAAALAGPLLLVWAATAAVALAGHVLRGREGSVAAADLAIKISLFAVASPLVAFSLYFAAIHAPRAFASLRRAGRLTGGHTVPLVLTLLGLLLGGMIYLAAPALPGEDGVVRAVFLLLSALTVPHMWLEWRLRVATGGGPGRWLRPRSVSPALS